MDRPTPSEIINTMDNIQKKYKLEEIACMVDRGYHTIFSWHKGKRIPHKGDWELLKRIEKEITKKP